MRYVRTNVKGTFVAEVLVGPGAHAGRTVFVNERDLWYGPQEETIRPAEASSGNWPVSRRQRVWAAVTAALAVLAGAVLARSLAG